MTCNYEIQIRRLRDAMELIAQVSDATLGSSWDVDLDRASVSLDNAMREINREWDGYLGQLWQKVELEQDWL